MLLIPFFRFPTRLVANHRLESSSSGRTNSTTRIVANTNATESVALNQKKTFPSFLFPRKRRELTGRRIPALFSSVASVAASTAFETTTRGGSKKTSKVAPPNEKKKESVHLKLGSQAMMRRVGNKNSNDKEEEKEKKEEEEPNDKKKKKSSQIATLHSYRDPITNEPLYKGLNMHKRKFCAWVNYTLQQEGSMGNFNASCITSEEIQLDNEDVRTELRQLWRQERLLSERTEVLAVYPSDSDKEKQQNMKRGGFQDLLHLYAHRMAAIIQDELEEEQISRGELLVFNDTCRGEEQRAIPRDLLDILNGGLLGWLQREYGKKETLQLSAEQFYTLNQKEQMEVLQNFMDWFRNRFPYYYDRCDSCGASAKDDPPPPTAVQEEEEQVVDEQDSNEEEEEENNDDGSSFLGYVYPTSDELVGKASRTEIYQCSKCGSFTRFPRYNSASSIIKNSRGRCGEYSMLLFRFLRAAGHEARWIVDWADHVWAEVRLNGRWIHLDPCEAAVDKPLLYQEWGKQQTYIVAFRAPQSLRSSTPSSIAQQQQQQQSLPLIEDVTSQYTSDHADEIQKRREESIGYIDVTVGKIANDLELLLKDILH